MARVGDDHALTISFGVAEFPGDGESPTNLLRVADRALYAAKSECGDRTVVGG